MKHWIKNPIILFMSQQIEIKVIDDELEVASVIAVAPAVACCRKAALILENKSDDYSSVIK